MNKIDIAICDDEVSVLDTVADIIKARFLSFDLLAEIKMFSSVRDLISEMKRTGFELMFLDIDMPEIDGITFGKELRDQGIDVEIIYISNREDKVFDSFSAQPFGFIRKGHFLEEITEVVASYVKRRDSGNSRRLVVTVQNALVTLDLDYIVYIEGAGKYQNVHQYDAKRPLQIKKTMSELETELANKGFFRVHKGYLVNFQYISLIGELELLLGTGEKLPISRRRVQEIKQGFLSFMGSQGAVIT